MAYRFTTPTISEGPAGTGRLFSRYRLVRGVSVLKIDGIYYQLRNPSSEEVASAQAAYIGGYSYEVNAGEKAGLEAAGYTVDTV
jgi:hypothetical protein